MQLINIGYGNVASVERIIAVVSVDSLPIRRIVQEARDKGTLIDVTQGKKTRSVLIMDSGNVILSAIQTETIASRANKELK